MRALLFKTSKHLPLNLPTRGTSISASISWWQQVIINTASVALLFNITSLRNVSNAAEAELLFDCQTKNINMSILVVHKNANAGFELNTVFYPTYLLV